MLNVIKIVHGCEVRIEKNREDRCLASQDSSDFKGRIFLSAA